MYSREENYVQGNLRGKDLLEDLRIFGRIILQMSSRNSMGENVDWIQLAQGMKLCLPAINTVRKPHLNKWNCVICTWCYADVIQPHSHNNLSKHRYLFQLLFTLYLISISCVSFSEIVRNWYLKSTYVGCCVLQLLLPTQCSCVFCVDLMRGRTLVSSINVFVVDLLERAGYFIYHEI